MGTQIFTTIPQQIDILKSRGLKFRSEDVAAQELQRHGYYNIINGYKDNYVIKEDSQERYRDTVYFEQIYSLFNVDHDIRNCIMIAMLEVEEQLKTQLAYVIAKNFTADYAEYSKITNYRNQQVRNQHFTLAATLAKLDTAYHSDKDPILYNRVAYGNVPPWVLFKGVYFSTVVNLVRFLKGAQKEELFSLMFDAPIEAYCEPNFKKMCADVLSMFREYRNVCAHGGRIYNHVPDNTYLVDVRWFDIDNAALSAIGIGKLLVALSLLRDKRAYDYLSSMVESNVNMHCLQYPDDADYILDSMGIRGLINVRRG